MSNVDTNRAKCLSVIVNSRGFVVYIGGSAVQGNIMAEKLLKFKRKHNLPLYTFAEDYACSAGYFILCIGNKSLFRR